MSQENEMIVINKVSSITGVNVNTLRLWCRTGKIPAERRPNKRGVLTWHTTVAAVKIALANPADTGRPLNIGG